jgi:3,2-trans-enoyl-CoA isomerase
MIIHVCYENTLEIRFDLGKGNLFSSVHLEQLSDILRQAETDNNVSGVILTGTGHSFSTGLDLSINSALSDGIPGHTAFHALDELLLSLFRFPKPVVAVINGHSVGAGFLIQLCSDYAMVADNHRIKMGLPELSLGLTIDSLMGHLAQHGFPSARMMQHYLYSSELFGPETALQIGVVDEIIPNESLISAARERVMRLLGGGYVAFGRTKQTIRCETIRKMQDSLNAGSYAIFDDLIQKI